MSTAPTDVVTPKAVCLRWMEALAHGSREDMAAVVHPEGTNRESVIGPPAARGRGPDAFYATALWLREAFAELRFEVHDAVAEDDVVALHATMHGRSAGDFVRYDEDAKPMFAFPGNGNRIGTTQTHWFRVADGKVIEHWANRDDIGTAEQLLGRVPSPRELARMAAATVRVRLRRRSR